MAQGLGLAVPGEPGAASALSGQRAAHGERAWALKRGWTDTAFQGGAEANRAQLQAFEDELVGRLRGAVTRELGALGGASGDAPNSSAAALSGGEHSLVRLMEPLAAQGGLVTDDVRAAVFDDPEVLGSSLDIVGAYLKNYEVDKASAVIDSILPACRRRGGLWLLKCLNHLATVRMKQSRPSEALEALREVEAEATCALRPEQHDEAWEFWETVYRNFGWVLSSLGQEQEAIAWIQMAVDVKDRVGEKISWFDLWDIGRMKASVALQRKEPKMIQESQALVTKALWMHRDAEPSDLVMRAKVWHSVGECSFALGHLAEESVTGAETLAANPNGACRAVDAKAHYRKALKCFRESHKLFRTTEGPHNPLTGGEAQAASWCLLKLDDAGDAKEFLLNALEALSRQQSGWGDASRGGEAPALAQATLAVDRILEAHRRTSDREGLAKYFQAIERLCASVCGRLRMSKDRVDAGVYEKLVSSCSMVMVAEGSPEGMSKSQELLRRYMWQSPETPQAQLCSELMVSLRDGADGNGGDLPEGPGMTAFLEALAKHTTQR